MPKKHSKTHKKVKQFQAVNIEKIDDDMIVKTSVLPDDKDSITQLTKEQICLLSPWMKPKEAFLKILKIVGAEGHMSNEGEIYTFKQIVHYLKEYIKLNMLYDENDPRMVYCSENQLGKVLQVNSFSIFHVPHLIWRNVIPLEIDDKQPSVSSLIYVKAPIENCISPIIKERELLKKLQFPLKDSLVQTYTMQNSLEQETKIAVEFEKDDDKSNFIHAKNVNSPSTTSESNPRKRKFSKTYDDISNSSNTNLLNSDLIDCTEDKKKGYLSKNNLLSLDQNRSPCKYKDFYHPSNSENGNISDNTEVLSIMSKETALIQDSTDDLWFLEEENVIENMSYSSNPQSTDIDESNIQVNEETLEPNSYAINASNKYFTDNDYNDEDWWADYELSDVDTDINEETNYSREDSWLCNLCDTWNTPICRYCSRCFGVRSGWLRDDTSDNEFYEANKPEILHNCYEKVIYDSNFMQCFKSDCNISTISSKVETFSDSSRLFTEKSISLVEESSKRDIINKSISNYLQPTMYAKNSQTSVDSGFLSTSSPKSKTRLASVDILTDSTSHDETKISMRIKDFRSSNTNLDCADTSSKVNLVKHIHVSNENSQNNRTFDDNIDFVPINSSNDSDNMCLICLSRPKNACLIHGKSGHQACCFKCAKKLRRNGHPCPICRKKIQRVIRNFIV